MLTNTFEQFAALHRAGDPVVLHNVWDVGSARAVADAGAAALATSSWAVAMARGHDDGEYMPMSDAIEVAAAIKEAVELPVSIDFEGGYAQTIDDLKANARKLAATGIVGCNFEDRVVKGEGLFGREQQAERIAGLREAVGDRHFINARTDLFLSSDPARHGALVEEAIERGQAYASAGASGYFVPGLTDISVIAHIVDSVPLPVNVMLADLDTDLAPFRDAGVARISFGPALYIAIVQFVGKLARMS